MKKKIIVLGCGLVGATMAKDLSAEPDFEVTVADFSQTNLDRLATFNDIHKLRKDLGSAEQIKSVVKDFDQVVGAMPSKLGFQTLRTVIESGKSFCDISFMIEDALELDELAKQHGVTVVYDCGVAPGLANMLIGRCHAELDETTDVVYYVGGLPRARVWPFEYKAPFAPSDVIEEYTRPARLIENGHVVTKPALSEPELMDFPQIGTLEGFNTDGLRSLLKTIPATNMREKTLRYPGHCGLMRVLRDTGFFNAEEIEVRGQRVRPLDVTSKLLFQNWRLEAGEEEFTVLRVVVQGRKDQRHTKTVYDLFDQYDAQSGDHSMARTTAFPCTIMARMIAKGVFREPGVFAPEHIGGRPALMDRMIKELAEHGVVLKQTKSEISA